MTVGIVDYGLGNISAFYNIYKRENINVIVIREPCDFKKVNNLILPGVGSFDWAMQKLSCSGLIDALNNAVINKKLPILGVCVGMQIMAKESEEGGSQGLGWIDAKVRKFSYDSSCPLPHMGWNKISTLNEPDLFKDLAYNRFYFLHSYFFEPNDKKVIISESKYIKKFTSAINFNNIYATQFHPEKSHSDGTKVLINFINYT